MRIAPLLVCVALAACGGGGGTSLDGTYDCSGTPCTSGQVCLTIASGIDGGTGGTGAHYCTTVPSGCDIVDCMSDMCSTCIQKLCDPTGVDRVSGRDVSCYGQ